MLIAWLQYRAGRQDLDRHLNPVRVNEILLVRIHVVRDDDDRATAN